MAKDLFDKLLDLYFTPERQGRRGEKLTERELKLVRLMGRGGKILRNVYVPKPNGETSEIDVIYITQKGIFVIESKNYSGWIFGNETDRNWTQSLKGGMKSRFQNPIIQNRGHIKWLGKYLQDNTPLFSIIAFSERCELKKVTVASKDIPVINRDRLYATVRNIWDDSPDVLDEAAVEALYDKLEHLTHADAATKEAHVATIKAKHGKSEEKKPKIAATSNETSDDPQKPEAADIPTIPAVPAIPAIPMAATEEAGTNTVQEPAIAAADTPATKGQPADTASATSSEDVKAENQTCPRCGAPLVLRTAKKGANAGNQFYGCSKFPHCRYTKAFE